MTISKTKIKMDRQSGDDEEMKPPGSGGGRSLHIPNEIIEEYIVVNLPAKSLFRFKAVSKSWFNLFKTIDFIYKHSNDRSRRILEMEEEEEEEGGSYLAMCWVFFDDIPLIRIRPFLHIYLYELCDDTFATRPSRTSRNNKKSFQIPGRPLCIDLYRKSPDLRNLRLVCNCNGTLCFDDNGIIMLVNPFLSELKRLPGEFLTNHKFGTCLLGFGFDKTTMDYKVVRLFPSEKIAEVYSVRSNAWRKLDETAAGIPQLISLYFTSCTFFDGKLYWVVALASETEISFPWRILTFNLATELFQLMECPLSFEDGVYAGLIVSNQESPSLAFVLCHEGGLVNLWTMEVNNNNEEEATTSWTKLYSIQCSPHFFRPVCFSISKKHNTFIYLTKQVETSYYNLMKYDVMNQSSSTISEPIRIGQMVNNQNLSLYECYNSFQVGVCRPSLFGLNSM